ncbi:MAG: signal peptide peptidase A [Polyangiaceae bacterium]|nr:signal peptide peptidase A [Polyangiaceae bacterium]
MLPSCEGRMPFGAKVHDEPSTGPALIELNLSRGLSERGVSSLFGAMPGTGYADALRIVEGLDDKDDKAIFVRLGTGTMGFSVALELGERLERVRKERGLEVFCHADDLSNATMLFASKGCSKIWLSPAGGVESVGIAFSLIFGRSLLDKLSVGVDFLQVGKYKGAQEPYTRDEPSPEARESLEGTLRDLRKAWIDAVSAGRGKSLEAALEDGPHTAKAALELGLIDEIGYVDEARDASKKASGAERTQIVFGPGTRNEGGGFSQIIRSLSGADVEGVPHVAVVRAVGAITMGPSGGLGGGDGITESGLGKVIKQLEEDESAKAVVLRIDSPGGSALASDLLWHRLMKLRAKKPLIISVGGMAASGGYYLSCSGTKIFAEPTSIVGSIGVVAGKFALHDTLRKIDVNTVTISVAPDETRRNRASYLSPFDRWDDATKAKVLTGMESIYETFLDRIVEGRKLDRAVVSASAEGRIFGGATAKERQLVDEIGGLDAAIKYALEQSGLGPEGKVRLRDQPPGLLEMLGGDPEAAEAAAERAREQIDPLAKLGENLPEETRTWFASATPMMQGETFITALPFVLMTR